LGCREEERKYLPVLGVPAQHSRILGLADLTIILLFGLLNLLLSLELVVLGEGAGVTLLWKLSEPESSMDAGIGTLRAWARK
jgi:hypothetical protein